MFTTIYLDLLPSLICQKIPMFTTIYLGRLQSFNMPKNPYVHYHLYGSITIMNMQKNPYVHYHLYGSITIINMPKNPYVHYHLYGSLTIINMPKNPYVHYHLYGSITIINMQKIPMFTQKIPDFPITKAITLFIATSEQILLQEMIFFGGFTWADMENSGYHGSSKPLNWQMARNKFGYFTGWCLEHLDYVSMYCEL